MGTGGIHCSNGGTLELAADVSSGTFISLENLGRLRSGGTGAVHTGTVSVASGVSATIDSGPFATDTLSQGPVSGGSGATTHVNGSGTISLIGTSAYAGACAVDSGTLRLQHAHAFTGSASVNIASAATVRAEAASNYAGPWTVNGLLRAEHAGGRPGRVEHRPRRRRAGREREHAAEHVAQRRRDPQGPGWLRDRERYDHGCGRVGDFNGNSINGLGFKNGDAKQANSVVVNNGVLAIGVVGAGSNTPPWLRANVTLSGGALASINPVTGQLGGDFILAPARPAACWSSTPSPATQGAASSSPRAPPERTTPPRLLNGAPTAR